MAKAQLDSSKRRFTCFQQLPTEIRLKIWMHASCQRRYLDIWDACHGTLRLVERWQHEQHLALRYVSLSTAPAVLHACRESRQVALKHYHLSFAKASLLPHDVLMSTPPRIYVNWEYDVVCPIAIKSCVDEWLNDLIEQHPRMRNLALNCAEFNVEDLDYFIMTCPDTLPDEIMLGRRLREILVYHCDSLDELKYQQGDGRFAIDFVDVEPSTITRRTRSAGKGASRANHEIECKNTHIDDVIDEMETCFEDAESDYLLWARVEARPDYESFNDLEDIPARIINEERDALRIIRPVITRKWITVNGKLHR